ncbi:MAG: DUF1552 domain-containing protein [Verrucomicrobiales bacterium]|nr:DUF1552 domain-containing protein [Verrucomicrobiales bacterium]
MKSVPRLSRRTVLRGLGSTAIALPLLEEMLPAASAAAAKSVPTRSFNLFFGLGIPAPLQKEGYDGVIEPLKPLKDKLLILRQVDQVRCDQRGINAHFDGSSAAFTATPPNGEAKAGGASIDQFIRKNAHPNGMPAGMVPTLVAGTFFRRSRVSRYVHSYNEDGTVAAAMQERPRDVFERVFGTIQISNDLEPDARKERLKRSVLDSVVDQYKHYTGKNSPLGATSKARVNEHLERIREYEQRAYGLKKKDPNAPERPPTSKLLHGGSADPGGQGVDLTLDELTEEWRLMADLYALSIQLDRVRFGSLTFLAAGERIRLTGDYVFNGKKIYEFNDLKYRNGRTGDKGCSHEYWHEFREEKSNEHLRMHAHMKMRELAYFLNRLDEGENALEGNGKTILDNSLITISTESGDGRHNDVKRELSGIFHAITGANGRFKTGQILDVGREGLDVYNTMLETMGAPQRLGPADREKRAVDAIRV